MCHQVEVAGVEITARPARPVSGVRDARRRLRGPKAGFSSTRPRRGNGAQVDVDKVPSAINAVDASQIRRTDSLNIADALQQYVPGVSINEVDRQSISAGCEFRGFVASPVAGTPQGLAVYQNGVRINEAFSDTVNWDLIPTAAIRSARS